jgi:hypothetical protein
MSKRGGKKRARSRDYPDGTTSSPEPPWLNGLRCQRKSWYLFGLKSAEVSGVPTVVPIAKDLEGCDEQKELQKRGRGRT